MQSQKKEPESANSERDIFDLLHRITTIDSQSGLDHLVSELIQIVGDSCSVFYGHGHLGRGDMSAWNARLITNMSAFQVACFEKLIEGAVAQAVHSQEVFQGNMDWIRSSYPEQIDNTQSITNIKAYAQQRERHLKSSFFGVLNKDGVDEYSSKLLELAMPLIWSTQHRIHEGAAAQETGFNATITPSERELLYYIGEGLTTQQIADKRCRSLHTIKNQIRLLLKKFQATHRAQLVYMAERYGLILEKSKRTKSKKTD